MSILFKTYFHNMLGRCIFGLFLCLLLSTSWANVGSIVNILGSAKIQKRSGQVSPAIRGDILYEGDSVWTEISSNVQIRMVDGAMIWVRPTSELKIESYKSAEHGGVKNESSLRLLSGGLRTVTGAIAKKNPENYRLATPNATIGVRGTEFDALYVTSASASLFNSEAGTYHRVLQGSTKISSDQQEVNVSQGQAVFVSAASRSGPSYIQNIPEFLNLPPASTSLSINSSNNISDPVAQIKITVRYGSSSNRNGESVVLLDNEKLSAISARQLTGLNPLLIGSEVIESSRLMVAMTATRPTGRQGPIQLVIGDLSVTGRQLSTGQYRLNLELPAAIWTETTDLGPWQAVSKALSVTSTRYEIQKVFVNAEEIKK